MLRLVAPLKRENYVFSLFAILASQYFYAKIGGEASIKSTG